MFEKLIIQQVLGSSANSVQLIVTSTQTIQYCLVFRKKDLYLVITQKLTFMKSGGFHADFVWISPEICRISYGFHLLKSAGFRKTNCQEW